MNRLLRLPAAWFALPMLLACGMTLLTYHLPPGYLEGILLLASVALITMLLDASAGVRLPALGRFPLSNYIGTRESFVALAFAGLVVLFCVLDLALFPVPLFDKPTAYASMAGGREHIRHVSDMCWVLPPIGLLCTRKKWLRHVLIAIGLAFPVLVIDRNRLFASVFCIALVIALKREGGQRLPWKTIAALLLAGCGIFSALGIFRSGSLDGITLPFSAMFRSSPLGIQWLLLYASAGPYNFGAMLARHYSDASFLIHQLVPMSGSIATAGTGIPLDAPTINVGTEFFPFLLALGPPGAVAAMLALHAMLRWSARRMRTPVSLFSLLIFLRIAYVGVMSPFAPQAFTWTTAGFITVCLAMQMFAAWLPNTRAPDPSRAGAGQGISAQPLTQGK